MATATKTYSTKPSHLPPTKSLVNRASFNPARIAEIELSDGSVHTLPGGTAYLYTQHRLCGDYYCLIEGKRSHTAIGDTLDAAFLNALAKAA